MPPRSNVEAFLRSLGFSNLVSETKASEAYCFEEIRQRWGTAERGIEFVERTDEHEVGSRGIAIERTYAFESYGFEPPLLQAKIRDDYASWSAADSKVHEAFEVLIGAAVKPDDPARLDRLARDAASAIRSGNWTAAKRDAAAVLQFRPTDFETMFALGLAHAALDEFGPAEDLLRRVLAEVPAHVDALYCMGNLRLEQKNYLSAEEHLRKAVAVSPRNHPAWARLGFTLESMGRRREAIPAYENALETSPNPGGVFGYTGLDFTNEVLEALARLKAVS